MKMLAYGGVVLVPIAVPICWRKFLSMNERLLFFRIVSSNTPIVWRLGVPGGRVLACNLSSMIQTICLPHVVRSCTMM